MTASIDIVRRAFANALVRRDAGASTLGSVTLMPHQRAVTERARDAIRRFRGALIADDVGSGKTFAALAVATAYRRPLVIAPAVLREMWSSASARTGASVTFVSMESLGRGRSPPRGHDLIIADEAHHLRNPATRRHAAVASIARHTPLLLLSGTPVHNSSRDLVALLSLFLGADARDLTDEERAAVVVRSNTAYGGPRVAVHARRAIADSNDVLRAIRRVPTPVPVRDGDTAPVLLRHALLRAWCSSAGALEAMARRAFLASSGMADALEAGRHPTKHDLRAWSGGEDGQLAFGPLFNDPTTVGASAVQRARRCADAMRALRDLARANAEADNLRASELLRLVVAHAPAGVLACTQYAATVESLWQRLRHAAGVCALTSRGARIASGPISRAEALGLFAPVSQGAPAPHYRERIRLLIATDLVSEGLNLQDAGVVVHLDLPWTAARLAQRVARVARVGSPHGTVHVYTVAPPRAASALLALDRRIAEKRQVAEQTVGGATRNAALLGGAEPDGESPADARARVSRLLEPFATEGPPTATRNVATCAVVVATRGWMALVEGGDDARIVCRIGTEAPSSDPVVVARGVEWLCSGRAAKLPRSIKRMRGEVERWVRHEQARLLAGAERVHGARARTGALASAMSAVRSAAPHRRARAAELAGRAVGDRVSHLPAPPTSIRALAIFVPDAENRGAL